MTREGTSTPTLRQTLWVTLCRHFPRSSQQLWNAALHCHGHMPRALTWQHRVHLSLPLHMTKASTPKRVSFAPSPSQVTRAAWLGLKAMASPTQGVSFPKPFRSHGWSTRCRHSSSPLLSTPPVWAPAPATSLPLSLSLRNVRTPSPFSDQKGKVFTAPHQLLFISPT